MKKGIVVGCDSEQEWLLKWWWDHYSCHNSYPVAFVDFGMSEEAKKWAQEKGNLFPFKGSKDFVFPETLINEELVSEWEENCGPILWHTRKNRFFKPLAMREAPFEEGIWIDLDCEVKGSLTPLFNKSHPHSGIAIGHEKESCYEETAYNSGVVVFQKGSYLIDKWAEACQKYNDRFFSDQEILGFLIHNENIEISEISDKYNWRLKSGINVDAVVIHWEGLWGKQALRREINQKHHSNC